MRGGNTTIRWGRRGTRLDLALRAAQVAGNLAVVVALLLPWVSLANATTAPHGSSPWDALRLGLTFPPAFVAALCLAALIAAMLAGTAAQVVATNRRTRQRWRTVGCLTALAGVIAAPGVTGAIRMVLMLTYWSAFAYGLWIAIGGFALTELAIGVRVLADVEAHEHAP